MIIAKLSQVTYHRDMSLTAVGAYLKALREHRDLTLADVASAAGTNEAQVIRIEKGDIDTRGSLLLRILRSVQGRADDVAWLITDSQATAEDGRLAAEQFLTHPRELSEEEVRRIASLSPRQRNLLMTLIEEMRTDFQ